MKSHSPSSNVRTLLHEKLDAMLDECDLVMDNAEFGQVLNDLDHFLFTEGRNFAKEVLKQKLQERIERNETTTKGKQCPHCQKKTKVHYKKPKTLTTSNGPITVRRRYRRCSPCKKSSFPVDVTFGMEKSYTTGLTRIVSRCCGLWSYRLSADTIKELIGFRLSPTTVGNIADQTASEIAERLQNHPDVRSDFQKAKGETEFYADGTFVHIRNEFGKAEWREFKVGAYAKRLRGLSALPTEWHTRTLPEPSVVSAFASIADKAGFQELCQSMRRTLGVGGVSSALGDGAKWIWNVVREVFGKTDECLDVYHASEHISDCGKALFGESQSKMEWFERIRNVLLSEGLGGVERELLSLKVGLKESQIKLVDSLLDYFRGNAGRLDYCGRLASGRVIGSGLIEGACKNLVGRRLKQTGAPWRLSQANRIARVCDVLYSHQWDNAWKNYN